MSEEQAFESEPDILPDCADPSRSTFSIAKDEVDDHYHFLGGTDRYWIQPAAIVRRDDIPRRQVIIPAETEYEKLVVEEFARYFQKETPYDFALYSASGPRPASEQMFLVRASRISHGSYDFVVGAVGTERLPDTQTVVTWIWLHPFERNTRGRSLALAAWTALEELFGELAVQEPLTKPMSRFLTKNRPKTALVSASN